MLEMQRQGIVCRKSCHGQPVSRTCCMMLSFHTNRHHVNSSRVLRAKLPLPRMSINLGLDLLEASHMFPVGRTKVCVADDKQGEILYFSDDDDDLCPVDCVREFKTEEEFFGILDKAKETDSLVVVDFYRTSCGSCKYIEQGFSKLCKGSGDENAAVIFLKHNVLDEYDEQSEVAERLRIKTVPLFHFYKNGVLVEAFPTRDKERIVEAILKYTTSNRLA